MEYLLDTNILLEAQNRYYSPDICPGFWDWLNDAYAKGVVGSITSVYSELAGKGDSLSDWVEERQHSGWFLDISDKETQDYMIQVTKIVAAGGYKPHAVAEFLSGADPWLIAKAKVTGATVVTHEIYEPLAKKKVKIPNVCKELGVSYADTFELLRNGRALFIYS